MQIGMIGLGRMGMNMARRLLRGGHEVVVYEALHAFGGVLIYGIPEFRLPKEIVRREIKNMEKMKAIAESAFSPPESRLMRVSFLPGG